MYAFSDKETSWLQFQKAYLTMEGSEKAVAVMRSLFEGLGHTVYGLDSADKVKYHAAAVLASNAVVGLFYSAQQLLSECGFAEEESRKLLAPLITENVSSIVKNGCAKALTGPVERADVQTVKNHLAALQGSDEEAVYRSISKKLTALANAMLTAYDYSTAKLQDEAGIHGILVGDSLGNVILGYEDTISVTMEDMIHHGAAVARGAKNALVVVDMPFMSYQTSVYDAVVNAGRLMKEGRANAVKLEGGVSVCPQIKAITDAGIPVMAHLGLTPQSINAFGGFKVQGKNEVAARKLIDDAKAVEEAGAFALVLECVPAKLAKIISEQLTIPTIGIGAGAGCDGQILVYQDMLGMFSDYTPKFVKRFAEVGSVMKEAFANYIKEVQAETYPADEHTFKIDDGVLEKLY